jgi:hypothetical protein
VLAPRPSPMTGVYVVSSQEEPASHTSKDTPQAAEDIDGFDYEKLNAAMEDYARSKGYESLDQWLQPSGPSLVNGQEDPTYHTSSNALQTAEDIDGFDDEDFYAGLEDYARSQGFESADQMLWSGT